MNTKHPHNLPWRYGVGLCIFNKQGMVFCAERRDTPGAWQMPQGGISNNEDAHTTVKREMKEEIGTDKGRIIGKIAEPLRYEFPDWLQYRGGVFRGRYRGQEQTWFALLFEGCDSEIDLANQFEPERPEFIAWRWVELSITPSLIVPFKRPVYERIAKEFKTFEHKIKSGEIK